MESEVKISITTLAKEIYSGVLGRYASGKYVILKNVVRRHPGSTDNRRDVFVYPVMRFKIENIGEIGITWTPNSGGKENGLLVLESLGSKARILEAGGDKGICSRSSGSPEGLEGTRGEVVERILDTHRSPRIERLFRRLDLDCMPSRATRQIR
ncbi:uncharacterized protein Eint_091280 [Encephalitozoon intestinalis ATCC 50506]|uniref:Uncharacterized protein n=1 Tax=Encephalitozoon intestinalis (strain ATCC 50506) TaxID=876142 RepID=E0S8Z1_ENCIT|nr:uncharacterized protein Eint_091280 [Encephalitozoon intestinalis ATCC 50506]ADM12257.1 hypothetical protein Eint_091280 [Encephalitozoon intestinalis ATCC 50506]UTX46064.1 hypothetical protein GPK93_09g16500 [Encephalitozoon intestinalis]